MKTPEIDQYRAYLEEKRTAENTISAYLRDITQFADYLEGGNQDLLRVGPFDVNRYIRWMTANGKAASSANRSLAAIRSFYRFLIIKGKVRENPAKNVDSVRLPRNDPEILTIQEVDSLLSQPDCTNEKGCRDRAMLELLYATGIRASELISLNLGDVNLTAECICCQSGKRDRVIPIYRKAAMALREYLEDARPCLAPDGMEVALFVNMGGERMSRQGFWKLIKHYKEKAGIRTEISPRTLRHSFAVHLLENGADLQSIQKMMGHADISSTRAYCHIVQGKLREVYRKSHPRA